MTGEQDLDKLAAGRPQRVLVVEDEWLIAAAIADELQAAGYEVAGPVGSVQEAVDIIDCEAVNAAVLDIHLHNETSFAIADALARRDVPFIFSSGFSQHRIPPEHQQRGLLSKPLDPALLLGAVAGMTTGAVPGR